jgi:hypothetical protein
VIRLRLVPLSMVAALSLLLAAGASAKPHKGGGAPLVVSAPKSAALTVGQTAKLKVAVVDHGHAAIAKVVLLAKASKGVTVKPAKVKVGKLAPGKKHVATFKVTATSTAGAKLVFVAKAPGQATAHDGVALKVAAATPPVPAIVGRYFWNSSQVLTTTYLHGYYFVDEHTAYRGIPSGGLPTTCTTPAVGEEDGCVPYTWNEATGALTIGSETGEWKPETHGLKLGSASFSEAAPPEAGTKVDAEGSYINEYGLCPLSCSFVTVELKLSSAGEFARASGVSGFFGEGGSYGALPPEEHGTYSIDPRGRVTFTYADGHTTTETIAFLLDDNNNPDPNYGILLGDQVFFGPHSND